MIAAAPTYDEPRVRECLRRAVRDFYDESWRLITLNALLTAYVLVVLSIALYVPLAAVLLLGAGPLGAALVSAAVTIVDEGSLSFREALEGFRRSWRRGLVLGGGVLLAIVASVFALGFYAASGPLGWPLAVLVLYLAGIFALWQLVLWPLAVRDPERPFRAVARDAAVALVRRPVAATGLGLALLLVNLLGLLLGVLPFLTMTIAYSALAAARFALHSRAEEEEVVNRWPA
jgi:MFS family permease